MIFGLHATDPRLITLGTSGQAGELVLAALTQGEPVDAAAGELVEDLVGGELGAEDQQPQV